MAVYVDNFSCQDWEVPARPVRQKMRHDQNKTAENKGVWEFASNPAGGTSRPPAAVGAAASYIPGACGVLTPPIVKAIP